MKNDLSLKNAGNINCELCKEFLKKPIYSKCGHVFCKICIISNMECKTCNIILTKSDIIENSRLNIITKNKIFEENSKDYLFLNKLNNNYLKYNNNVSISNNDEKSNQIIYNNFSSITNDFLKNEFNNKIKINKNTRDIWEKINNYDYRNKINKSLEENEKYRNNDVIKKDFDNGILIKNDTYNLFSKNTNIIRNKNKPSSMDIDNQIILYNGDNKSQNFYKNNECLIELNDIKIGRKRLHKEFIKGQNILNEEKYIKKFPMNFKIKNIDIYNKETLDFFFDKFANMFNPNDNDLFETVYITSDSDLLGNKKIKKN